MEDDYGFVPQMQWYDNNSNPYMQGYEEPANMVEQESAPLPEDYEIYPDYDFSDLRTTNNRPVNSDYLNYIYKRLRKAGYDDKHTAILLGQIAEESGGDPFAVDSTGTYEGLLQWAPDRYQINTFHDDDPYKEINRQLKYLLSTIDNLDDGKSWTHGGQGSGYNSRKEAYADWAQEEDMARMNRGLSFGHVRPTSKAASARNRFSTGSQIYDIVSTPVDNSIPEMLARNAFAEGGETNTFWPGGPVNRTPQVIATTIGKGIGLVTDLLSNDPKKQERVVEAYHNNAHLLSPRTHAFVYDTLKDAAFSEEPMDNIIPDAIWQLRHPNTVNPDNVFLMPPEQQKATLSSLGYVPVDTSSGYGLVNAAVQRYKNATGREVPMYQIGEDDIARDDVIPLDLNLTDYGYDMAFTPYEKQSDGALVSTDILPFGDAGTVPTRVYRDKEGNLYIKKWDFFDHGDYSRRAYEEEDDQYRTKSLTTASQKYGNLMDIAGNPFVKVSALKKHPDQMDILRRIAIEKGYGWLEASDPRLEDVRKEIISGSYDVKPK